MLQTPFPKFHGIFGLETIEAFVFQSFDDLAHAATVITWASWGDVSASDYSTASGETSSERDGERGPLSHATAYNDGSDSDVQIQTGPLDASYEEFRQTFVHAT